MLNFGVGEHAYPLLQSKKSHIGVYQVFLHVKKGDIQKRGCIVEALSRIYLQPHFGNLYLDLGFGQYVHDPG